jgi:hypothetical protein
MPIIKNIIDRISSRINCFIIILSGTIIGRNERVPFYNRAVKSLFNKHRQYLSVLNPLTCLTGKHTNLSVEIEALIELHHT